MGEAKRKSRRELLDDASTFIGKTLADEGKLIEAGFFVFASSVISRADPEAEVKITELRLAFMAGAEHLFSSIMFIMDAGDEPTEANLRRMDLIQQEIDQWRGRISEHVQPAKGRA